MPHLVAATLTVSSLAAAQARYSDVLDYETREAGALSPALAAALDAPALTGAGYCVMGPKSGQPTFLRLIEAPQPPAYRPLTTYGWAAVEINVVDCHAAAEKVKGSVFEIIGPPKPLDGMPFITALQMRGPDQEIVYLTQIEGDLPGMKLPRAQSFIDRPFILVLACSELHGAIAWLRDKLGFSVGAPAPITYTVVADAFGLPHERKIAIAVAQYADDAFLEADQYPPQARPRAQEPGKLPPGVAIASFLMPNFADRLSGLADFIVSPPLSHPGPLYAGRRAALLKGPDGTLYEVIEP
jgi:hypothetical protein